MEFWLFQFSLLALAVLCRCQSGNLACCTEFYVDFSYTPSETITDTYTDYASVVTIFATTLYDTSTVFTSTISRTHTRTHTVTSWTTEAATTITVPTSTGFTPFSIASVETTPTPTNTYSYVFCSTTKTIRKPTTITIDSLSLTTITASRPATTRITASVTETMPATRTTSVRTVYAACNNPVNTGNKWRGLTIGAASGNQYELPLNEFDYQDFQVPHPAVFRAARQSPQDCCNAVFALGDAGYPLPGFLFTVDEEYSTRGRCYALANYVENDTALGFCTGEPIYFESVHLGAVYGPTWFYSGICGEDMPGDSVSGPVGQCFSS